MHSNRVVEFKGKRINLKKLAFEMMWFNKSGHQS
jgi:hypothetical protein